MIIWSFVGDKLLSAFKEVPLKKIYVVVW
jgi:hypothetical protein